MDYVKFRSMWNYSSSTEPRSLTWDPAPQNPEDQRPKITLPRVFYVPKNMPKSTRLQTSFFENITSKSTAHPGHSDPQAGFKSFWVPVPSLF